MKIQIASDLHIEFPENREYLKKNPLKPCGDILVLAGDIVPFAQFEKHQDFFIGLTEKFKSIYWIPGNHEYYKSDIENKSDTMTEKIAENFFLVNNIAVVEDNIKLIFSTIWSKIGSLHQWVLQQTLTDFHLIKNRGYRFTVNDFNLLHQQHLAFLNQELAIDDNYKRVVVTHHCPTFINYPEKYKNSFLNEGFATELAELIEFVQPEYWIYGHTHFNTPPFKIGNTTLVTNQLGYVAESENQGFNNEMIIEI